MDGFR